MKNIKVVSLNKSHEYPEEFMSHIINLTFSKKLNTVENINDKIVLPNKERIIELTELISQTQSDLNNKNLLSENQFIDFDDIYGMLITLSDTTKKDNKREIINTIIARLNTLQSELHNDSIDTIINKLPLKTKLQNLRNVVEMKHTGMLEHVNCTYLIQGASRSFLAQITRHRLFSFVSASQHYMDYSDFGDFVIPIELENADPELKKKYLEGNKKALQEYSKLIKEGIPHEAARQLLPNSMRNNLIVTGNLREWLNFLNLRLCNRNTTEIQYVAMLIKEDLKKYVPTLSEYMAPDCITEGHCTQKHLYCGETYSDEKITEKYKVLTKKA